MLDKIAWAGMKVVMNMSKDSREWASSKEPKNGTVGRLVYRDQIMNYKARFGHDMHYYAPGIYASQGVWYVLWEGEFKPRHVSSIHVKVHKDDRKRYERKAQDLWYGPVIQDKIVDWSKRECELNNTIRIADLPETKFYEGDVIQAIDVSHRNHHADNIGHDFVVARINYDFMQYQRRDDDDRGQLYDGTWYDKNGEYAGMGTLIGVCDRDYELVRRGNVWKHYHNEPVTFRSLKEELSFHQGLGKIQEVRNPKTNLYSWTLEEFLEAVLDGIVDCMTAGGVLNLIPAGTINAMRCEDRDLGERVRKETMTGFNIN